MDTYLKRDFPFSYKIITTIRDNTKPLSLQFQNSFLKPLNIQMRSGAGNDCSFIKTLILCLIVTFMIYFIPLFFVTFPVLLGKVVSKQFDLIIVWLIAIMVAALQITYGFHSNGCPASSGGCEPLFTFMLSIFYTVFGYIIYAVYRLLFKGKPIYKKLK